MRERRLFVIATPRFSAEDTVWLAGVRERHDPLSQIVPPHVTFVFDAAASIETRLVAHVARVAATLTVVRFALRRAAVHSDALTGRVFAYLLPEEGKDALVGIHDRLHEGVLASAQRRDAPYLPHVTVGAFDATSPAESLVDRINRGSISVIGTVESLRTVAFDGKAVQTIAETSIGAT